MDDISGGRFVLTGTNFFIDNWGMAGLYQSNSNHILAQKIAFWIIGMI